MNTNDDFNAEYVACYEQYRETAEQMRPCDFYVRATSEGVSNYYASCLLWNESDAMQAHGATLDINGGVYGA